MNNYLLIGKYFPGNSFLHRLNPEVKVGLCFLYLTSVFMAKSVYSYLVLGSYLIFLLSLSQISFRTGIRIFKTVIKLGGFLCILNGILLVYVYLNSDISMIGAKIYKLGIYILRLALFMGIIQLLFLNTSPLLLVSVMERSFRPMSKFKFPLQEFSMMMLIALRFLPIMLSELDKIIMARRARGDTFQGNLKQRLTSIVLLLNPLLESIMRRVDDLAVALEVRGFQKDALRPMKKMKLQILDFVAIFCSFFIFILSIVLSYR